MAPILSQVNPLHTPQTNLPRVHFDPILPSPLWSFKCFFPSGFHTKTLYTFLNFHVKNVILLFNNHKKLYIFKYFMFYYTKYNDC
jgi:hypothetical protein